MFYDFPSTLKLQWIKSTRDVDQSPGEMSVVVTLYVSKIKKKLISMRHSQDWFNRTEDELKSNLVTDFDETNGYRFPKKNSKHVMPTES